MTGISRVAFIAGATGALGTAICNELAAAGMSVVVHAHSNSAAATTIAEQLPGDHLAVTGELMSNAEPSAPVQQALATFGRIDVVVNAAHPRLETSSPVATTSASDLQTHLDGVVMHASLCRDVVPTMRAQGNGRIVFVAGALMQRPAAGFGAYGAAKAAAATLTRYVALEEGRHGITANIVALGRVVDDELDEDLSHEKQHLASQLAARLALGSFPSSSDVARVISMLVQPAADAITGQTIWVTGGEPIT